MNEIISVSICGTPFAPDLLKEFMELTSNPGGLPDMEHQAESTSKISEVSKDSEAPKDSEASKISDVSRDSEPVRNVDNLMPFVPPSLSTLSKEYSPVPIPTDFGTPCTFPEDFRSHSEDFQSYSEDLRSHSEGFEDSEDFEDFRRHSEDPRSYSEDFRIHSDFLQTRSDLSYDSPAIAKVAIPRMPVIVRATAEGGLDRDTKETGVSHTNLQEIQRG